MPIRSVYRKGLSLATCSRCSATYYSDQIVKEWNGALVCKGEGTRGCWEPRHIIDSFRSKTDNPSVEDARPRKTVDITEIYPNSVTGDDL